MYRRIRILCFTAVRQLSLELLYVLEYVELSSGVLVNGGMRLVNLYQIVWTVQDVIKVNLVYSSFAVCFNLCSYVSCCSMSSAILPLA